MAGPYPNTYPIIEDWPAYAALMLPDIAANGKGAEFARILFDPLQQIDDQIALIYAGCLDINDAAGAVLDLLGDQVNEARGGLGDVEYRSVISGARVVAAGAITPRRVLAGWQSMTSPSGTIAEPGYASVKLLAPIAWVPSDLWLTRAGAIVRKMIGAGYQVSAAVYLPTTAIFDQSPLFDVGTFAYDLRTT